VEVVITCRVCAAHEYVGLDNEVLLCGNCRSDPSGALKRLKAQVAAAQTQLDAAGAQLGAALGAAHPRDRGRYSLVVVTVADALTKYDDTPILQRVLRSLARAGSAGDELATLLAAEVQLREIVQLLQTTYSQVRLAREECLIAIDSRLAAER